MSDAQFTGDQSTTTNDNEVRASDTERAATVERLKAAHGEGRLTLDEFSDRIVKAREARTRGSLHTLVADLPAASQASSAHARTSGGAQGQSAKAPLWHIAPIGGWKQRGHWRLDRDIVAISLLGGVDVDLTNAQFGTKEVTLTVLSVLGGTEITVPRDVRVEVEGFSLLGGRDIMNDQPTGIGAPVFRVRVFGLIGGLRVRNS